MSRNYGRLAAVLCLAASALAQTPVISSNGILNGASFRLAGAVAPGSIISIFGSNLATSTAAATSLPLTTTLSGTSVTIGGRAAPLFYVSATQINAQVPWATTNGSQAVVVTANGARSAAVNVTVQAAAPGIFTQASNGRGAGAIQTFLSQGNTPLNTVTTAVAPGGVLIIYSTALGAVNGTPADGVASSGQSTINPVTVRIGTQTVNADSANLTSGYVGLYQVNVHVPSIIPEGCFVPVQVVVGGQVSNSVSVSVAKNGDCTALASETTFAPNSTDGLISLTRTGNANSLLVEFFRTGSQTFSLFPVPPAGGGCLAEIGSSAGSGLDLTTLNAGPLTYTPPGGAAVTLNRDLSIGGIYSGFVGVATGTHTVSGNGGTGVNVGAFSAAFNVASLFSASTSISSAVSQTSSFTTAWNACADPNGKVVVIVSSQDSTGQTGTAACSAVCTDRSLLMPSAVLGQLPLGPASVSVAYVAPSVRFTATGLTTGLFSYAEFAASTQTTLIK